MRLLIKLNYLETIMKFETIEQLPKSHQEQVAWFMLLDLASSSKEMLRLKELISSNKIEGLKVTRPTSKYNEVAFLKDTRNNRTVAVRYMGNSTYKITTRNANGLRKLISQNFIDREKISFKKTIKQEKPDFVIYRDSNVPPTVSELLLLILRTN